MEALRLLSERDQTASRRQEALLALAAAVGDPRLRVESVRGSLEDALAIPALESLLAALSDHPLSRAADAAAAVERAREELARAQAVPDLNVELLYRRQEATHTDAFDAGLSIALPLFDRNQGRIREAGAELTAAQAKARRVLSELEHEVREAHLRLTRAMARVRLLREEILPRSDTVLRGAELRYAGGDMSLADLLPIRRDRLQVRLSYLEALREAIEAWRVLKPYLATKG
jgi:cobalt-zinc-cadmium efflux system outer membrane protein